MYIKEIKDMINLMNENGLTELEIEKEGVRIKLRKGSGGYEKAIEYMSGPPSHGAASASPAAQAAAEVKKSNTIEIKSPMVGTFYAAPAPDQPAYATMGKKIKEGDVLCIVEAMKLMNEIKSEVRGKVAQVVVENAEPVEFGQTLFVVDPV